MIVKLLICFLALHHHTSARFIDQTPSETEGLYDSIDDVVVLSNASFNKTIFNQSHGTLVEFYNSFCGFCKRYAPSWKEFASDVIAWQSVVQVAAVNCAADENSNLCRKYEIMAYPCLRYFPAHFNDSNTWGIPVEAAHEKEKLRSSLVASLRNQTNPPAHWPKLMPIQDNSKSSLFNDLPNEVQYIVLVYAPGNSTLSTEVALDVVSNPNIAIKWVNTIDIASNFGLSNASVATVIGRNLEVIQLSNLSADREALSKAVYGFLKEHNLSVASTTSSSRNETKNNVQSNTEMAKSDLVYLKDIQHAAWFSLDHEVAQFSVINGERLEALKRYINILKR